jgi:signal peptidase II
VTVRPAVWLAAVLVVSIDLFTKQWALDSLVRGETHQIVDGVLALELVFNSGAAFSLLDNYTWAVTIVVAAVTVGIVYYARRARTTSAVVLFGIALGGAVGNLIDRLFREPGFGEGHVVDMIKYGDWFVGNVADIAIVGSAVVFMVLSLLGKRPLVTEPSPESSATAEAAATEDATS